MSLKAGERIPIQWGLNATDLAAGVSNSSEHIAPADGYLSELQSIVQEAIVTGGTLTVKTGNALGVTVAGLTQTIADAATKGTRQTTQATAKSSTKFVSKGDRIVIEPANAFNGGGAMKGTLWLETAQTDPAL